MAKLDATASRRMAVAIRWLSGNVDTTRHLALKGNLAGFYKYREGDYRIIYEVLFSEKTAIVHAIGHRHDVYKKR